MWRNKKWDPLWKEKRNKNLSVETESETTQMLEIAERDFKNNYYKYVQCLKEKYSHHV